MTSAAPTLVIFHGGGGRGEIERAVMRARAAVARETAQTALSAGFSQVIVATDTPREFTPDPGRVLIDTDRERDGFDLRTRLLSLIEDHRLEGVAVIGSGALPLMAPGTWADIAGRLAIGAPAAITNNFYSADLTAWTPAAALANTRPFARDNAIPRRLRDDTAMEVTVLPRTTGTQFDLDTPTDLALLALHDDPVSTADGRPEFLFPVLARLQRVLPLMCSRDAQLVVLGRVGSAAWQYLERETACRVRLYSEERGLATAPHGYVARSALGYLLEAVGPVRFFEALSDLGDAALIDTRVLTAHAGRDPTREDRFRSDLLAADGISDPWLAEFTRAAAASRQPVILGGHSLVSGGLMALNDAAWAAHESAAGSRPSRG